MSETVSLNTDSENQSLRKIEKDTSLSLGQYGAVYKTAPGALSGGPWGAIQATATASVNVTSSNWTNNSDATTGIEILIGATIFGNFTAITLVSGKIIAYKTA